MKGLIRRRSLIFRLLLLSVAAVALPALLISAVYRSISSRALLESIQQQQTELARRIAGEVNDEVRQAQSMVALVAHSSFFSAGSRVDQSRFKQLKKSTIERQCLGLVEFIEPMNGRVGH